MSDEQANANGSSEGRPNTEVVIPPDVVKKIRAMRNAKYDAEVDLASLKSQTKAKQAELEELNDQLWRLNADLTDPRPLFAGLEEGDEESRETADPAEPAETGDSPASPPLPTFPGHTDWKTVPVGDLTRFGLTKKLVEKMVEGGLGTIGDIGELNAKGLSLTDVKGVGDKAAEKIDAALDLFWKAWGEAAEGEAAKNKDANSEAPKADGTSAADGSPSPADPSTGDGPSTLADPPEPPPATEAG